MRGRHRKKVSTPPDLILLSKLEEPLLLLADHLERVDEGAAPVQRVSGHQDKGGLRASVNRQKLIQTKCVDGVEPDTRPPKPCD